MGQRFNHVEDYKRVRLLAVAASGNVHAKQAAVGDGLNQIGGDAAVRLNLVGAGADHRLQLSRPYDKRVFLVRRKGVVSVGHECSVDAGLDCIARRNPRD